jgi:hypothetical protein
LDAWWPSSCRQHGFLSMFVFVSFEVYVLSSKLLVIRIKETTFTVHVVFSTCLV